MEVICGGPSLACHGHELGDAAGTPLSEDGKDVMVYSCPAYHSV